MKLFILSGELSGETHAARVLGELIKQNKGVRAKALGSKLLEAFGAEIVADYRDYSVSGFTEVVLNLGKILKLQKIILNAISEFKPDVILLVDFAGFNLEIAKQVKSTFPEIKIVEYIAPQIWASRPWRISKIKKNVDKVLCTLPFEEEIYLKKDIPVRYVGNPVASSLEAPSTKSDLTKILFENSKRKFENSLVIGLFPGSRKSEIKQMLPVMAQAAKKISQISKRKVEFVLAQASTISTKLLYENGLDDNLITVLKPSIGSNNNQKLLSAADLLWLCSGTVTLEAAIYGTPYFLAYKGDWLSYQLYKIFKTIDMAGLSNIIAGKYIVPEFLQYDATVDNFVKQTLEFLDLESGASEAFTKEYKKVQADFADLKLKLVSLPTAELVAQEIIQIAG